MSIFADRINRRSLAHLKMGRETDRNNEAGYNGHWSAI